MDGHYITKFMIETKEAWDHDRGCHVLTMENEQHTDSARQPKSENEPILLSQLAVGDLGRPG